MKPSFVLNCLLVSSLFAALSPLAHADGIDPVMGWQLVKGDEAKAIFNAITSEATQVIGLDHRLDAYTKSTEELSCWANADHQGTSCFVSGFNGRMPSLIPDGSLVQKLYALLSTRELPLGVTPEGQGTPTGYYKTVAGVECIKSVNEGRYPSYEAAPVTCTIRFRQ